MIAFGKWVSVGSCWALVACAGDADNGDAGQTADSTAAADSTARDAGIPPIASGAPTLRANGIGDIDVGIALVDATDHAGSAPVDPDAGAECRYVTFPTLPEGVSLMVLADTVRRIDVDTPDVLTERGAGVGMTGARIEDLYGSNVDRMPHKYEPDGEYLIVTGTDPETRVVFETANDTVRTMHAGLMPEVMWVERCG